VVAIVAVGAAAVAMMPYYRYFAAHVTTDDAYVDGNIVLVTPRVSGTVTEIYVMDNWSVRAGDLLIALDPRDFEVRVEQAEAQLERARETVDQLFAQLSAGEAGVKLADAQLTEAQLDFDRARSLRDTGVISRQAYDQAVTALGVARANKLLAAEEVESARAALGGDAQDRSRYERPVVQQAQAALDAARLDLSYTKIQAALPGIITHKSVHVGHRVQVGQPLMSIVPTNGLYVTANFKETQLTDVRVGQSVDLRADIYPGQVYPGHVDSISMGTGSAFALLPPENATGNWVKVVQRIPVKIVLDSPPPPDKPLRLGLSVDVSIDVADQRGPRLTSTQQGQHESGALGTPLESLRPPAETGGDRPRGLLERLPFLHRRHRQPQN
jgi:membrane fusion protein, multidrug efflux system